MKQVNPEVFDYIIIGSGFGGSVSAMRLSEKGYKVLVIEQGKRFRPSDFPKSDWNLKKYLWMPSLHWHGIMKLSFFRKVFILSGTGVGGGSLVYACTLLQPKDEFFENQAWPGSKNWKELLKPYYDKARKMLGAARYPGFPREDELLQEMAVEMGVGHTFEGVDVGIYFGDRDQETDPYFGGEGPVRKGCTSCAGCMTGCRERAKNTLDKNYLWFAEKNGTIIRELTIAVRIEYIHGEYRVNTRSMKIGGGRDVFRAKGLVVSGAVLGTLRLLLKQKHQYKTLPFLSDLLGHNVRTNSESLSGIVNNPVKLNNGPAITSLFRPDPRTAIQLVKFNDASGAIMHLSGLATDDTNPARRTLRFLGYSLVHPVKACKVIFNYRWGGRGIVMMVMQTLDNSMTMKWKNRLWGGKMYFDPKSANVPSYIPEGQEILHRFASKVKGTPVNCITELLGNLASTAHIIGGCPMSDDPGKGVVDSSLRVHHYPGMYIIDSSIIPGNLGVNPSLTITALAEYAMDQVPAKKANA